MIEEELKYGGDSILIQRQSSSQHSFTDLLKDERRNNSFVQNVTDTSTVDYADNLPSFIQNV